MERDTSWALAPCVSVVESKVESPMRFMPVFIITCALMSLGGGANAASRSAVSLDSTTSSRSKRA